MSSPCHDIASSRRRSWKRAVAQRTRRGRALDLGCGQGIHAVYLAQHGFSVVAVDFVPADLAAARTRAEQAGVEVELREGDVVDYEAPSAFDVVLDSDCLHHLPRGKVGGYRNRLDDWLAPGGDYVLVHFAHRPRSFWIPTGPRHMTRDEAVAFFAPLELQAYDETHFDVPLPMGRMRASTGSPVRSTDAMVGGRRTGQTRRCLCLCLCRCGQSRMASP